MRFHLKQIALAGLLTCLSASALAANYFFVQPKSMEMSKASPLSVALNPSALPEAVVGLAYNNGAGFDLKSVLAVSGDSTFNPALTSFAITSGTLPAGLTVSTIGVLSGTPTLTSAGSSIQVTASYKSASGTQTYQVISLNLTVTLGSATLPLATVGAPYNGYDFKPNLAVTGDAAFTITQASFKVADGSELPSGLVLSSTGVLTGTPSTATAGASFTVQAAYKLKSGQQAYTIVVNGAKLSVLSISAGESHTCAVTTSGGLKCWGTDGTGQLGNDAALTNQATPVDVLGLTSGVASVSAGGNHTCAVTTSGGLKCWGYDSQGQLGNDAALTNKPTPVDVLGLMSGVASVSAGGYHTCAVTTSGGLKCWGYDFEGNLGNDAALTNKPTPVDVFGLTSGVASVAAGTQHTCAVTTSGGLKCWGNDAKGQLGNDAFLTDKSTPVDVLGFTSGVASVAAGGDHTCAVTTSGGLKCWGDDSQGQLGNDAALTNKPTPVDVFGLTSGVASVAAGGLHTCAVTTGGGLKCWGTDGTGQLGNDAPLALQPTPVDVLGLTSGVANVSGGYSHTCAITTGGGLKCWGYDGDGRLGNDAALVNQPTPVDVLP
jgi:alpha-tubulin suppressor-like RCC1 family protein